jgi:DNA ligase (NAD+)
LSNILDAANDAYYNKDEKVITDTEFDLISDDGLEIKNFRVKTEHEQPMGSLKKLKTQEAMEKFVGRDAYSVTPKLDGNSIELVYEDGVIIKAITRGDGFFGNDVTDKIEFCNIMDPAPREKGIVSRKCEAIMPKDMQCQYEKNIRNVVSGMLNRKTVDEMELSRVDVVCFAEMTHVVMGYMSYDELEERFQEMKENYYYEIDGFVLKMTMPKYEETDELLPANIQALKFNKEGVDAEVGYVEWNLGKHGKLTPVLVLKDAVEIDGAMIQRVSASNWGLLEAAGLGKGAKVQVIKSGDIIPFISKVLEKSPFELEQPYCPDCSFDTEVSDNGIHCSCVNPECDSLAVIKLKHIFRLLDLEFISTSTVEALYDNGYENLAQMCSATVEEISALPRFGTSKANNIVSKLNSVELTEWQVLNCAMVKGVASSQSKRLIEEFGSLEGFFKNAAQTKIEAIEGMGSIMSEQIVNNLTTFIKMSEELKAVGFTIIEPKVEAETSLNVVCTGTCSQYGRKELVTVLEANGIKMQKAINKDTDILLTGDVNSTGSKMVKAKKLGVKIQSYNEFFNSKGI